MQNQNTTTIAWYAIHEAIDEDGIFLQNDEAIAAEIAALRAEGAPIDGIRIVSVEPEDRDEAIAEAEGAPEAVAALRVWFDANDVVAFDEDE